MADAFIAALCERIKDHATRKAPLRIRGGGTKDFYGAARDGEVLDVASYAGIVAYEPKELVVTVRSGTKLRDLQAELASQRQMLAFEPPHFGENATIGGTVACAFSGPRRPYAGSLRDFVLGTRIVNGKGEDLSFGGRVIKNVAGYDVSRLMAGALGTLGIITEISFKVLPRPAVEATLAFEWDQERATQQLNFWAGQPLPLSATSWQDGHLRVRLSGAPTAVSAAKAKMGGDEIDAGAYWESLREHRLPFFAAERELWRLSVPQTAPAISTPRPQLIEWGGGLRWAEGPIDMFELRSTVERLGGHAAIFRGGKDRASIFHPLRPALAKIHKRLKLAFDPAGILNPGRMYDF
jgi:glycolate oxidase FAD binding subunit